MELSEKGVLEESGILEFERTWKGATKSDSDISFPSTVDSGLFRASWLCLKIKRVISNDKNICIWLFCEEEEGVLADLSLDMVFRENESRARIKNLAGNLATLKHISFNILKKLDIKPSVRVRRKLAGWDTVIFS